MDAGSEWVNWTVDSVEMSMSVVVVVGRRTIKVWATNAQSHHLLYGIAGKKMNDV